MLPGRAQWAFFQHAPLWCLQCRVASEDRELHSFKLVSPLIHHPDHSQTTPPRRLGNSAQVLKGPWSDEQSPAPNLWWWCTPQGFLSGCPCWPDNCWSSPTSLPFTSDGSGKPHGQQSREWTCGTSHQVSKDNVLWGRHYCGIIPAYSTSATM